MITKELLDEVVKEATLLKQHATPEELGRLNYNIKYWDKHQCVYGKLTTDCFNDRATQLLNLCARPLTTFPSRFHWDDKENRVRRNTRKFRRSPGGGSFYSAIEIYIAHLGDQKNIDLVNFLKGHTDVLVLAEVDPV